MSDVSLMVAEEYLENKKGLDQYEVALLAYDIEEINHEVDESRKKKEKIDNGDYQQWYDDLESFRLYIKNKYIGKRLGKD